MADWRDRLRRILDERGLNMKQLSLAAGLGETAVRDMLQKVASPRVDTIVAVADQLGITLTELLEGRQDGPRRALVIGYVSAGEGWTSVEGDGPVDEIELNVDGGAPVALIVRGDSMTPVYRDGDVIVGARRATSNPQGLVGSDCIVETRSGERYVKFVARGTAKGRYALKSYNPAHPDIENVDLAWAAPISMVIRAKR
jgi:transcriptional regulator with XRE-family HTH domain